MAETRSLSITVGSGAGVSLPSGAVLEVDLLDVSRADAPSVRVASQRYLIEALPVAVRLPYESAAIDDRMTYVVAARVTSGGAVVLRTTRAHPVLTRGAADRAEVVLEPAGGSGQAPAAGAAIVGGSWAASEIGGRALIADDPPTIAFMEDGSFAMFGGCNRFRGTATLSGDRIAFGPIAGTRRMCQSERMKLEGDMVRALEQTVGYQRNGPQLSLVNAAGVTVARFRYVPG